jgi:hypothetical protein
MGHELVSTGYPGGRGVGEVGSVFLRAVSTKSKLSDDVYYRSVVISSYIYPSRRGEHLGPVKMRHNPLGQNLLGCPGCKSVGLLG